jgi:hypothetical protein
MKRVMSPVFLAMLFLSFLGAGTFGQAVKPPKITGTYSNMSYIREAGDVIGYEIKIVFTGGRFQGALQIAEGVPGDLILVDIEAKGSSITFAIPDGNPYAGRFSGAVENGWLKGKFSFKLGGKETVALRRGKSYWD